MSAKTIKEILKKGVIRKVRRASREIEAVREIWLAILPEKFQGHSRVLSYHRRVLEVGVDSPAVLAEMEGFHRDEITDAVRKAFSAKGVTPPARIKYTVETDT